MTALHTATASVHRLPADIAVWERGWLSSNQVLLRGEAGPQALVDSGYVAHAEQTLALVRHTLPNGPDLLLNTHLHSDHCGGNAALQAEWPALRTLIPPGMAEAVRRWDAQALGYPATGQRCPRFRVDGTLVPGQRLALGARDWEVHAAPGHDPHAVLLFEPRLGLLLSADALWQNGFGVVFPELDGPGAFDEVADTLDLIERLSPRTVVPGHGAVFSDVTEALARARQRLDRFRREPAQHRRHAAKVLLKFKLLEWQRVRWTDCLAWAEHASLLVSLHQQALAEGAPAFADWLQRLVDELGASGALRRENDWLLNA